MNEANWIEAGQKLKELRLSKEGKPSVHKVAKSLQISGNYYSELERGLKCPSDVVLHSLSDYYDIDRVELFGWYGKVVKENMEFMLSNKDLHKTMSQISTDKRLTDDDKDRIVSELSNIYKELIAKKSKKDMKK